MIDDTYALLPAPVFELVGAHLRTLLRSPLVYIGTLLAVVSGTHIRGLDRLRSLAHFIEAVSVAPLLAHLRVDHLHAHFAVGSATCAWVISRLIGVPWSLTAHAYDIWLDKLLLPEKIRSAAYVVTCSEVNRRHLIEAYGARPEKIHTVYHGIDVTYFSPSPTRTEAPEVARLLCVGRLVEQKGITHLIDACAKLMKNGHAFQLVIAGDGPLRGSLERQTRQLGLEDRVRFVGHVFQDALREHYRASDLFVLPCVPAGNADRDGIPNTLIEAMACGVAVISTEFSGVPELVEDGATGLLVPPSDPERLASAIERLVQDPSLRSTFAQAARESVVERFALDVSANALLRLTRWDRPATEEHA